MFLLLKEFFKPCVKYITVIIPQYMYFGDMWRGVVRCTVGLDKLRLSAVITFLETHWNIDTHYDAKITRGIKRVSGCCLHKAPVSFGGKKHI